MKTIILIFLLMFLPVLAFAGGTFIVTNNQYITVSGQVLDTLGRTYLTADSVRITVADSSGTELFDGWFNSGDAQATLNGDVLTFFDQWNDINGAASVGTFSLTATFDSDDQGAVEVFEQQKYVVMGVTQALTTSLDTIHALDDRSILVTSDNIGVDWSNVTNPTGSTPNVNVEQIAANAVAPDSLVTFLTASTFQLDLSRLNISNNINTSPAMSVVQSHATGGHALYIDNVNNTGASSIEMNSAGYGIVAYAAANNALVFSTGMAENEVFSGLGKFTFGGVGANDTAIVLQGGASGKSLVAKQDIGLNAGLALSDVASTAGELTGVVTLVDSAAIALRNLSYYIGVGATSTPLKQVMWAGGVTGSGTYNKDSVTMVRSPFGDGDTVATVIYTRDVAGAAVDYGTLVIHGAPY